jgi:hypothetical protein
MAHWGSTTRPEWNKLRTIRRWTRKPSLGKQLKRVADSVVFRDDPPNGIKVFESLKRQLKRRIHPCGFSRSARRCRNISTIGASSGRNGKSTPISLPLGFVMTTATG